MKTLELFIKQAKIIHGDKYDYSKCEYNGAHVKVCIICPIHGEFWQTPHSHLKGSGCPKCKNSLLENKVRLFLDRNDIHYIYQYFPKFLNDGSGHQSLDFYLPEYNIAIECQGIQHFEPQDWFGHRKSYSFTEVLKRDKIKKEQCEKHGIKMFLPKFA